MIAKRAPREKGTSDPARLVRYMVAAVGGIDPNTWARTSDYILDTKESTIKGEKVASYRVTNCGTDDPAAAAILIQATQASNTKSKTDKTYHLIYSFPPGETPSLEVLHAIEDELVSSIGFADHHRVSAVHTDTDHLHVHVAINKVHPTGLQNIEPYYDKRRLMEACERLEIEYGLQRTNHGLTKDKDHDRNNHIRLEPGQRPNERDSRFRRYLRESYDLKIADEPEAKTLNGLRKLSGCRLDGQAKSDPVLLPGDARSGVQRGGENDADSLRRPGNGDRTDDGQDGKPRGVAADIEAESGIETLTGYAARELAPAIRKATSWQEVHAAAAEHGLEVNKRGAGLVIGDPSIPLWTKASSCGRDLSLKALTDRLGPFEPSEQKQQSDEQARKPGSKGYTAKPRQSAPSSAALFAQYQRERQGNVTARRDGLAQVKREGEAFNKQLQNWRNTQRMLLKVAAKGPTRRLMQSTIKAQGDASRAANSKAMAERRQKIFEATTTPAWADWLVKQAEKGNAEAIEVLRSQEQRERRWHGDLLTAEKADRAKAVVLERLKPKARKDGTMAYHTVDGGMVIDRATHVQAQKATTGAALVALELASKRFEGQELIVEGTAEFRQEVAQLAGMHGLNVRFVDPMMEQIRRETADHKDMEKAYQAEVRTASRDDFAELVAFGKAPYDNIEGNRPSYFVTLSTDQGERTLWGVDLERAVTSSGAVVGDSVRVDHMGTEAVTLPNGREVQRNDWRVEVAPNEKANTGKPSVNQPEIRTEAAEMEAAWQAEINPTKRTPRQRTKEGQGDQPKQPVSADVMASKWIEERNKKRDKISSIDYHRLWTPKDAGKATYQGRRRMEDGSEVLLLKRGDETLVKPSGPRVVAKASKLKIGQVVQLDARGRFVDGAKGVEL
ncbi:TPA: TraI/MobA(P) family conjugative relaxase [Yersinia enterocolitica]